jgi:hypothetical protein
MINYKILDESINFYEKNGFSRVESPWTVTQQISQITKPQDKIDFEIKHNGKVLVASGEQSFLYLYLKGFLPKGRFQTITPCFRYESFDFLHTKYFIKNELIDTKDVSDKNLESIVQTCLEFFQKYLPGSEVVKTEFGYDIEWKGYELGSYGIRSCEFLDWIYATGVAEPRFSSLINLSK